MPTLLELLEKANSEEKKAKSTKFDNEQFNGKLIYSASDKELNFVKQVMNKQVGEKDGR